MTVTKISVYDIVTSKVLEAFDKGTIPWQKPWKSNSIKPCNAITGREYNGGNYFLLSMMPYAVPAYMTIKQMNAIKATIKPGQEKKYMPVFYWNFIEKIDAKGKKSSIPMLKYFLVWNVEQLDNYELPEKFKSIPENENNSPIVSAQAIIDNFSQKPEIIVRKSDRAFYSPTNDTVTVPEMSQYSDAQNYYAVIFHELAHSTGHSSRLNRDEVMNNNAFASHAYSCEELVAELTSAFICAEIGLDNTSDNSTAYIASWYKQLKSNPKLFWIASGKAQKACDYIMQREKVYVKQEQAVA